MNLMFELFYFYYNHHREMIRWNTSYMFLHGDLLRKIRILLILRIFRFRTICIRQDTIFFHINSL